MQESIELLWSSSQEELELGLRCNDVAEEKQHVSIIIPPPTSFSAVISKNNTKYLTSSSLFQEVYAVSLHLDLARDLF